METLLLDDAVYVQERYQEIEQEQRRQHAQAQQSSRSNGELSGPLSCDKALEEDGEFVWPPSWTEKKHTVMHATLSHLAEQMWIVFEAVESGEVPVEDASTPRAAAQQCASTSAAIQEFPVATQLGLKLFFRLCASLRDRVVWSTNGRMLTVIAAKIPSILASLPPLALSPGILDGPLGSLSSPSTLAGEVVGNKLSVFQELIEIFGKLLYSEKCVEKATNDADRATIAVAYVALALKWGRMGDIMRVLMLLHNDPGLLSPEHIKILHPFCQELAQAEVEPLSRLMVPGESSPTGYLVTFGKGDHGKLGHGQCSHASCAESNCTENKTVPTVIASARDIKFVKVDSLSTHSVAITTKGEVMAWGNGDKYRLGHGTTSKEYSPRIIDSLSLKGKVLDVACGLGHTLALMSNGDLYAWGNGSNGRLGLGDTNDRSNPTKVIIPDVPPVRPQTTSTGTSSTRSVNIRSVICGASHSLALSSDGRVFAWGKNNQGQCGHGHTTDQLTVAEVRMFRDELNEQVTNAAGGWEHSLFCSSTGRVYSCGCGYKDSRRTGIPPVLGHGDCEKRLKPTIIQSFINAREEIVRVACGWDHSLAISSQGVLYTWGSGTNGKLGHGDEENCEVPSPVRGLIGKVVKDAKAGCEHTVAITDNHELWTFGQGDSGRLGLGDTLTRKVPTLVDFFLHSGLQPVAIAVGDKYNLVLAEEMSGNHAGHRSPKKPPSPAKTHEQYRGGYLCNTSTLNKAKQHSLVEAVKRKRGIASSVQEVTTLCMFAGETPPVEQKDMIDAVMGHVVRLSSDYMTRQMSEDVAMCSWALESTTLRPYCVDASYEAFDALLELINANVGQSMPSKRSYRMVVACLRVLALNLPMIRRQEGSLQASSLLGRIQKIAKDIACPAQHGFDFHRLGSAVVNEATLILKLGFSLFYPTIKDRTNLLFEISSYLERTPSSMAGYLSTVLACICEGRYCAEIVSQCFQLSALHVCPRESAEIDATCLDTNKMEENIENLQNASSLVLLLRRMLSACLRRIGPSFTDGTFEKKCFQVLGVLYGQWFACALASTISHAEGSNKEVVCHCCVDELLKCLYDLFTGTLRKLEQENGETLGPADSFITFLIDVLLPVIRMTCAFVQSPRSLTLEHYGQILKFIQKLHPVTSALVHEIGKLEKIYETMGITTASNFLTACELSEACASLLGALARAALHSHTSSSIHKTISTVLEEDVDGVDIPEFSLSFSDMLQCLNDIDPSHRFSDEDDDLRRVLRHCLDNDEPFQKLCAVVDQEHFVQPTSVIVRCAMVLVVWFSGIKVEKVAKWCSTGENLPDFEDPSLLCARTMCSSIRNHPADALNNGEGDALARKALERTRLLMKFRRTDVHEINKSNRVSEWARSVLFLLTSPAVTDETLRTLLVEYVHRTKLVRVGLGTFEELLRTAASTHAKNAMLEELVHCTTAIGSFSVNHRVEDIIKSLGVQVANAVLSKELYPRAKACALRVWLWLLQKSGDRLMEGVESANFHLSIVRQLLHDCSVASSSITEGDPCYPPWPLPKLEHRQKNHVGAKLKGVENALCAAVSYRTVQAMAFKILSIIAKTVCHSVAFDCNSPQRELLGAILRFVCQMLKAVIDGREKMRMILTPLKTQDPIDALSQAPAVAHALIQPYLLASPISAGTVRTHISKPLRSPGTSQVASVLTKGISLSAVSFWLYFEKSTTTTLQDSECVDGTVIVALGAPSDKVQELLSATSGAQSLCFSHDDNLNFIAYVYRDADGVPTLGVGFRTRDGLWLMHTVDYTCGAPGWSHILFTVDSDGGNASAFINGDLKCMKCTSSSPRNDQGRPESSLVDSRTLFIAGGTIEESFSKEFEISTAKHSGPRGTALVSPRLPTASTKHLEFLLDDVWVFGAPFDQQTARTVFEQGRTIQQAQREEELETRSFSALQLLAEVSSSYPTVVVETLAKLDTANESATDTLLQGLELECCHGHLTEAATLYVEILKVILPVITPTDLSGSIDKIMHFRDQSALQASLRDQLQTFYGFSERASVQSTNTATAQMTMHTMLRQYGILGGLSSIHKPSVPRPLFNAQIVQLLQRLLESPAWRSEIELKLINVLGRLSGSITDNGTRHEVIVEALACASTIGGYNEILLDRKRLQISVISATAHQPLSSVYSLTPELTPGVIFDAITRLDSEPLALKSSDDLIIEECDFLRVRDCVVLVTAALRIHAQLLRAITGALVRDSDLTLRRAMLAKPQFIEYLRNICTERSTAAARRRLGGNFHRLLCRRSVRSLMDQLATSKPRQIGRSQIFLQEELEAIAMSLASKTTSYEAPSSISWQPWRFPTATPSVIDCLSGEVEISGYSVYAVQHFPSVRLGRVTITANSGLWYYEVHLVTDGLMQIGYVDTEFIADSVQGQGVGDHTNSWAFDGYRCKKWNVNSFDYGEAWKAGDTVGVLLDTDRMELSYFVNGKFLGIAFTNLPLTATTLMHPAISLNADQRVVFNFGKRDSPVGASDESRMQDTFFLESRPLTLPQLESPLDQQRLRPVLAALELSMTPRTGSTGPEEDYTDSNSDTSSDSAEVEEDNAPNDDCMVSETSSPVRDELEIYHPSRDRDCYQSALPGSLEDLDCSSFCLPSGIDSSSVFVDPRAASSNSTGNDDESDNVDDRSDCDSERKAEMVRGLTVLGFPRSWATRCANETTFTANDSAAVSWILEQMEREAASASVVAESTSIRVNRLRNGEDDANGAHQRRSLDDLSLLSFGSMTAGGRQAWRLSLSPARDGRPHSEQSIRNPSFSTAPSRTRAAKVPDSPKLQITAVNPFLLGELEAEDDDIDSDTWGTFSRCHSAYVATAAKPLVPDFDSEELKSDDHDDTKADTARRVATPSNRAEDLLPASLLAHSFLGAAYARISVEALLFGDTNAVAESYSVLERWIKSDERSLLRLLRVQLGLATHDLPILLSRTSANTHDALLYGSIVRLLRHELSLEDTTSFVLFEMCTHEIRRQAKSAVRAIRKLKAADGALVVPTKVTSMAMKARWTLWLGNVVLEATKDQTISLLETCLGSLCCDAFVDTLVKIAASANGVCIPWKYAAYKLIHMVLTLDAHCRRNSSSNSDSSVFLVPLRFFVELFARDLHLEQRRQVAFSELSSTIWAILLEHSPSQAPLPGQSHALDSRMRLVVDQVAATHIAVSWDGEAVSSTSGTSSSDDESFVLSLDVQPDHPPEGVMGSLSTSGTPHLIPSRGSFVLRHLAPDSWYTIRLTRTGQTSDITDNDDASMTTSVRPTALLEEVRVRTPPEPVFELDADACGKNLMLSNRNRTVKNIMNKKWHTVRASVAFEEGVHHWHVRIDSCASKNIFIGVCTADASLENYVGSDAYGYGFLANKAVWHNKSKVHSYGEIFKQGDLLQVSLDCNARTLSFSRNGEFLGIAATNLHVGGVNEGSSNLTGCKWYPAFSLYNKDDQLTIIAPSPSTASSSIALHHPSSQHASVVALVDSARYVMAWMREGDCSQSEPHPIETWYKWKTGDLSWREMGLGDVLELDASHMATVATFGLASGDSVFTSRGHCVVLGAHNHQLWYEVTDAIDRGFDGANISAILGSWSRSACREMLNAADEFPIHHGRRRRQQRASRDGDVPNPNRSEEELTYDRTSPAEAHVLTSSPAVDARLIAFVDALVAHRGLLSPHLLSYTDYSSAVVMHDVVEAMTEAFEGTHFSQESILQRVGVLFKLNQHVYGVVRLFLSTSTPSWAHAVCSSGVGHELRPDLNAMATRLAVAVGYGIPTKPDSGGLLTFLRSHLFAVQRERLISEARRRSATPTAATSQSDSKSSDLATSDSDENEPKEMMRLKIRRPAARLPFWSDSKPSEGSWMMPTSKEQRAAALFAQVSSQLSDVNPRELRREYIASTETLSVTRSVCIVLEAFPGVLAGHEEPGETAEAYKPIVGDDLTSRYLRFWDDVFTEIQSPTFPLFTPTSSSDSSVVLDINAKLLLPEFAVRCDLREEEALLWFFQLGEMLGMVWRSRTVVPLEFISPGFWRDLADGDGTPPPSIDRLATARFMAIQAVRDGLTSVIPLECLQLSTPQSLAARLSDSDLFLIDKLHQHAVYDRDAGHHLDFWRVLRGFSSFERRLLMQFLSGKSWRWPPASDSHLYEDPIDAWKRQLGSLASEVQPFVLQLAEPLADATDHPDACFPVVHGLHAHSSRLHLPVYSNASVLRQKLLLAIANLPSM